MEAHTHPPSILVIAAHPDDEVLGCGGSIPRWVQGGSLVTVLILGEGITARYKKSEEVDMELLRLHHERSHLAGRALGVKQVILLNLPDQRFDTLPMLEITQRIETIIHEIQPTFVYTQHGGDLNLDHAVTFRAVMTATRPMAGRPVKGLYAYEVGSSTEWSFQRYTPVFRPNKFIDITATLESKIAAMQIYESEARSFPHPRSPLALRSRAKVWGSVVGLEAAEPFEAIWEIG